MQTLYIDVYFLINFTVDVLALYFASRFSGVKSTVLRLVLSGAVGSAFACAVVLLNFRGVLFLLALVLSSLLISFIFGGKITHLHRFKLFSSFLIFETLIGGLVSFSYSLLDKYMYPNLREEEMGAENRSVLLLALLVLLAFGIIRIMFLLFSGIKSEKRAEIKICFLGKAVKLLALVDSGNLVRDPMSAKPVIIVKKGAVKHLLGNCESPEVSEDINVRARVRLIPVEGVGGSKMLVGVRSDFVELDGGRRISEIVIALDNELGDFGGFNALMPAALLEDI